LITIIIYKNEIKETDNESKAWKWNIFTHDVSRLHTLNVKSLDNKNTYYMFKLTKVYLSNIVKWRVVILVAYIIETINSFLGSALLLYKTSPLWQFEIDIPITFRDLLPNKTNRAWHCHTYNEAGSFYSYALWFF
jgi:hypothetical protein